jgi:aminomethyltransferase
LVGTSTPDDPTPAGLQTTPLAGLHHSLEARMVEFAGYVMPVSYPAGIIAEHMHCREHAALFDVSHMGQAMLAGSTADAALEQLVPGDIIGLKPGRQRYTLLTNEAGGIIDDVMVARLDEDRLFLVVNASRKETDFTHIAAHLPGSVQLSVLEDRALLALQGPSAASVLGELCQEAAALPFLGVFAGRVDGMELLISRSGYTGEDGFEISVPADRAEELARRLLAHSEVAPAGLGARDTLRLEAGLCLYGNDIDELTSPVEAGLTWVIGKRRRAEWNFPGAAAIRDQLAHGPHRLRVGIRPEGRAPARAGTAIVATDNTGAGTVTSGGYAPVLKAPISMGYVRRDLAAPCTPLILRVRGKPVEATVVPMPFVPHRYSR